MMKPVLFKILAPVLLFVLLLPQLLVQTGCANIVPPEGGPRDTLPPVLTRANPHNNTLNFDANRVNFSFDEYIDLDNYRQNLIISPVPERMPTVTRKLNTMTIKFNDTLESNTTYTFNFGKSIKDVNEGNVMKDFTYIFSTGSYIDSLQFGGKVVMAETGATDSTLMVMLHRTNEDSAVVNETPRYVTRLNGNGTFLFKNLPPGTFYVYALEDPSGSYHYLSGKQAFAFADSAIVIGQNTAPVTLYAYVGEEEQQTTSPVAPSRGGGNKGTEKRLRFQVNQQGGRQDLLEKFKFTFETPLQNFDSTRIHISTDTTYTPLTNYSWTPDSTMKTVTLNNEWKENTIYNMILEKDFATDTLGQQLLKDDTLTFTTKALTDYSKVVIRFRNLDLSINPVLQFVQANKVSNSYPLTSETITIDMFPPGEYSIRILADTNKNGKWDPGEFHGKRLQPEIVTPIERKLNIRANNFTNQFEIAL